MIFIEMKLNANRRPEKYAHTAMALTPDTQSIETRQREIANNEQTTMVAIEQNEFTPSTRSRARHVYL